MVIDESHNVTNAATQNNRLARLLAPRTEALILAQATPHNGRQGVVRRADPPAGPDGGDRRTASSWRTRCGGWSSAGTGTAPRSPSEVGADWAERLEPNNVLVPANADRGRVADELEQTWLHPAGRQLAVLRGSNARCSRGRWPRRSCRRRPRSSETVDGAAGCQDGRAATPSATRAAARCATSTARRAQGSAKYDALVEAPRGASASADRPRPAAVVFAERVATLHWLRDKLAKDLGLGRRAGRVLHGGVSDVEQQEIVGGFKQERAPIRVLVTGDVASEGVNLHAQCHELIHYDIPWSLIRIEQRNGRIDRYGQKHPPRITALLLDPSSDEFAGDIRVLHRAGGEGARGAHGARRRRLADGQVRRQGRGGRDPRGARRTQARSTTWCARSTRSRPATASTALLARLFARGQDARPTATPPADVRAAGRPVPATTSPSCATRCTLAFETPAAAPAPGGVGWRRAHRPRASSS